MTHEQQPLWSEPIYDLQDYHDLEARLQAPFRDLPRPEGVLYAVLGGERMGKTSLLNVLPAWLLQQPVRGGQRLAPGQIQSWEEGDLNSPQAFLLRLVRELREGLRRLNLCTISERDFAPYFQDRAPVAGFRDALNFLLEQARQASSEMGERLGDVRLIGLIDNAEEMAHQPWANDLFRELRGLHAREELVRRHLDLVLAGQDSLSRHCESGTPWADGRRICLHPLAPKQVTAWLQAAGEGQLPTTLIEAIAAASGGHPLLLRYFIHQTRAQVERRGWDGLPPNLVEGLSQRFIHQHAELLSGWIISLRRVDMRDETWSAYRSLTQAGDIGLDVNELEEKLWEQGLYLDVEKTLERLVWQGVVWPRIDDSERFVTGGLFRRYFQQHGQEVAVSKLQPEPTAKAGPRIRTASTLAYDDFELRLSAEKGDYGVRVVSRAGRIGNTFPAPFTASEQESLWQRVARPLDTSREVERVGRQLFRAIFQDEVLALFRNAWNQARDERLGLRLKLIIEPAELHSLPWELLYDENQQLFLALSNQTPLVRYVEQPRSVPAFEQEQKLRMLVFLASPADQPLLAIDRELDSIQLALEPCRRHGWLEYDIIQGQEATARNLHQLLSRNEYHIFHFLGHGAFDAATGQGLLLLEGPDALGRQLAAESLANLLRDQPSLRLAFLNACQTALTSQTAPFASVAGTLVQAGVPAVLATQYSISDTAASQFARQFYLALADGYPLEAAVAEGRKAIELGNQSYEWGVPVLYLRANDGYIFR